MREPQTKRVLPDAEGVAAAAADEFVRIASDAATARGVCSIALSGGSTPRRLHTLLTDPAGPYRHRVPWDACHFFWGDERHVPPDHPDSNFRMARETLLDRVAIPPARIHRMRAELAADQAAQLYEHELRDFFDGRAWPVFDVVLLGMGPDAHTASLFPGTSGVRERERWVVAPWVEKLQTFRITLSPPAINAAAHIVFVVAGADKADALHGVLEGPRDADRWPSQLIDPVDGSLLWLVDRAAAAKLSGL